MSRLISELKNMKKLMGVCETTSPLEFNSEYFEKRIPFLKQFKDFSNNNKIFFQKIDYNENVNLMVGDNLVTFPQLNTSMEFKYTKDKINDNYRHVFTVKNNFHLMSPPTNNKEEELMYRVFIMGLNSITEKMNYIADVITKTPNLNENELNGIINNINKAYFQFEDFVKNKLKTDITNPLDENI